MASIPPEIWDNIIQFCDIPTLQSLVLVSRLISDIALPHLFHTVTCVDDLEEGSVADDVYWTDEVRRPALDHVLSHEPGIIFRTSDIASRGSADIDQVIDKPSWRHHLRRVFLIWEKKIVPASFRDMVDRISQSEKLEFLHLSIPATTVALTFDTSRITSLTTSVPSTSWYDEPDFGALLAIFRIASLKNLYLDTMTHLECEIDEEFHQPGCSNVESLYFINCGYPSENLHPLLHWPKKLIKLGMDVDVHPASPAKFCYGPGAPGCVFPALEPLKHSLQEIHYEDHDVNDSPMQGNAFLEYSSLKRLVISLQILFQNSDDNLGLSFVELSPPLHTRFPQTLEEVHFTLITDEFPWASESEDKDGKLETSREARELFEWLSGFIVHRTDHFINLRRVVLCVEHRHGTNCNPPRPWCPYFHDLTLQTQQKFADAGIELTFKFERDTWSE